MSSTALFPVPPPTTNTLEPSQRTRLRKSSRKLEAVLGATPIVLAVDVSAANKQSIPRPPITPRTRARRRRGQVFQPTASTCSSVTDDDATVVNVAIDFNTTVSDASSFIWVDQATPHGAYLPHSLPEAVSPTTPITPKRAGYRARSKSEAKPRAAKTKTVPVPGLPSSVRLELPLEKKTKKAQAQPVLLLRPLPPSDSPSTLILSPRSHHKSSSVATFTSITSNENTDPLSPRSPFSSSNLSEAQEREMKRKKMAKLARTLGENVPPELVFPANKKRERKASISRPRRKASISNLRAQRKPSVHFKSPSISTVVSIASTTTAVASPVSPEASPVTAAKKFKRANRPRSLSVPPASLTAPKVEIEQIVDIEMQSQHEHEVVSPITFATVATPLTAVKAPEPTVPPPMPNVFPSAHSTVAKRATKSLDSPKALATLQSSSLDRLPFEPAKQVTRTRAASSLDIERPVAPVYAQGHAHSSSMSLATYRTPADYVYGKGAASNVEDLHRRKEREWSGEWNVTDMGDVMKKLRELKGR